MLRVGTRTPSLEVVIIYFHHTSHIINITTPSCFIEYLALDRMQHAEIDDTDISTDDENGTFPETTMATTEMASNEYVLNFAFLSFVGFLSIQAVFAMIANSQAMLADCQAMAVDALTYLFNLWAERAKSIPLVGKKGREMTRNERNYHQELQRLYLELIPPAISCCTLIGITIDTLRDAFATLMGEVAEEEEDVSVVIMMIFSLSNLFLDIVNVTCFARSSSSSGLDWARPDKSVSCASCTTMANEKTPLVVLVVNSGEAEETPVALAERTFMAGILSKIPLHKFHDHSDLVNLNMCSAWTVR